MNRVLIFEIFLFEMLYYTVSKRNLRVVGLSFIEFGPCWVAMTRNWLF